MWQDVVDLRDFYDTPLGLAMRRIVRRRVRSLWPNVRGQRILGLGYATPYLSTFRSEAERILAFMPAAQGVLHWPGEGPGLTALVHEGDLPLPDLSVDLVLLVHALENSDLQRDMLREIWRVLNGSGRLLVVAPNRRGIWARLERTPLGSGHPYTPNQLSRLLRGNMFTPTQRGHALFIPPVRSRTLLRAAPAWERIGQRLFPGFSGVVLVEARKQLYAPTAYSAPRRLSRPIIVPLPRPARTTARGGPA